MDYLLDSLTDLAVDLTFNGLAAKPRGLNLAPQIDEPVVAGHPKYLRVVDALRGDEVLSDCFNAPPGFSFTAANLPHRILNNALWLCHVRGDLSEPVFRSTLVETLRTTRALAHGQSAPIPTFVGFGVEFPPGTRLKTVFGTFRPWRDSDLALVPDNSIVPSANWVTGRGSILETEIRRKVSIVPRQGPGELRSETVNAESWNRVALGQLLFQEPKEVRQGTWAWLSTSAWLFGPGSNWADVRQFRKGPMVSEEQLPEFASWIHSAANESLPAVAVDRTISMTNRLTNPIDSFIDAVIVWESLFSGRDNKELTYRISQNMACILSDDPGERIAFFKEIGRLYKLRSLVLHGAKHLNSSVAAQAWRDAQELTLLGLRRLLTKFPELIAANSEQFAKFVLGART